jgi:Putative prokaryotic signal transducing protein
MALVLAARFYTASEAQIVQGRLAAEGVESYLFDTGINLVEVGGIAAPVRVMVDEADLRRAHRILADWPAGAA